MSSCPARRVRDATFALASACASAGTPRARVRRIQGCAHCCAWMKRRVESGQPSLSGMFTRAEVTYAWLRDDGTVGSDREPLALFTGEAVHTYLGHLSDAAIEAMLSLRPSLFADRTWILDAGEHRG